MPVEVTPVLFKDFAHTPKGEKSEEVWNRVIATQKTQKNDMLTTHRSSTTPICHQ